jgi:hypothetical protein
MILKVSKYPFWLKFSFSKEYILSKQLKQIL